MLDKILEYCDRIIWVTLILFVIFSPLSITVTQAVVILAVLAWIIKMALKRDFRLAKTPLSLPIAAFLVANVLSLTMAVDFNYSFFELRSLFWVIIYFLVVNNIKDKAKIRTLINVLIIFTIFAALYGTFQHFTGIDFFGRTQYLHIAPGSIDFFRSIGFFSSSIIFGVYLSMVFMVILVLPFAISGKRARLFFGLATSIIFVGLVLTYSRSAWIGLLAALVIVSILKEKRAVLVLLTGVMLISLTVAFLPNWSVTKRVISITDLTCPSNIERIYGWRSSLRIIKDYPITGVGVDGFQKVYPRYMLPQARVHLPHAHNNFLDIAVGTGILGLGAFCWLLVVFLKSSINVFRKTEDRYLKAISLGCLGAFSVFVVSGLTEYTFRHSEVLMPLYFLMGMVAVISRINRKEDCSG